MPTNVAFFVKRRKRKNWERMYMSCGNKGGSRMREVWGNVDEYFISNLHPQDMVLEHVLQANHEAGLPSIDVTPTQESSSICWQN